MAKRTFLPLLGVIVFGLWILTGSWVTGSVYPASAQFNSTATPITRIAIGDQVVIRVPPDPPGQVLRLREAPGLDYETVINLADGAVATVIGGPEYSTEDDVDDGYATFEWWQIRVGEFEGWVVVRLDDFITLRRLPPPTATIGPCSNTLIPRLRIGSTARSAAYRVSIIRTGAGPSYDFVAEIPGRGEFIVLDGPICNLNFYWWHIQYGEFEGWVAEASDERYWLEPLPRAGERYLYCPGNDVQRIFIGQPAIQVLNGRVLALQSSPTISGHTVGQVSAGEIVHVIAGPLCYPEAEPQTWWQVRKDDGTEGWIAEGDGTLTFLESYVPTNTPTLTPTPTPTLTLTPSLTRTGISENAACVLTTLAGVNLRSGPGTTFEQLGSRATEQLLEANGQATDDEGFTWWRLITGEYVREDFVTEDGECESLEIVTEFGVRIPGTPTRTPSPTITSGTTCVITTLNGVNLRNGPGVNFERSGSAAANASFEADAQYAGSDGLTWWRIARAGQDTGSWVREDFVSETGNCDRLPDVAR